MSLLLNPKFLSSQSRTGGLATGEMPAQGGVVADESRQVAGRRLNPRRNKRFDHGLGRRIFKFGRIETNC